MQCLPRFPKEADHQRIHFDEIAGGLDVAGEGTEKAERTPEQIQAGQDAMQKEFEEYKRLREEHAQAEGLGSSDGGLEDAFDKALEGTRDDLYEGFGANKSGDKLERFKAGLVDGVLEKGELANEIKKDPERFFKKMGEAIGHITDSVENFTKFVKEVGASFVDGLTNAYELGKMAVDFVIGLALGGVGALGFKGAKKLARLRKGKETFSTAPAVATGAVTVAGSEVASVAGQKMAKETVDKTLTMAERLAAKPKDIEVGRWKGLVEDYGDFSPEQLKKAFEVEEFLIENEIDRRFIRETVLSADIDTVQIIKSSPEDVIAYRFYGEGASQYSYYYTPVDLRFIPEHEIRDLLSIPDGNSIERVVQVSIPKGSPMLKGNISPQASNGVTFLTDKLGGGTQIHYPLKDKNITILGDYNLKKLQNGDSK